MTGLGPVSVRVPRVRDRGNRGREGPLHLIDPATLFAQGQVGRGALALALSQGHFQRRLSGGACSSSWSERGGAVLDHDLAARQADWWEEYDRWQRRDLGARRIVHVWADGVYFQPRMAEEKQCVLVLIGADEWGRKEVLGLADGYRESTQSWRELLLDLKRRGLTQAPDLAIGDGALGFWTALREVFGTTREQRC